MQTVWTQIRTVGSGSKPFDTLIVFLKECFEKDNFENYPAYNELIFLVKSYSTDPEETIYFVVVFVLDFMGLVGGLHCMQLSHLATQDINGDISEPDQALSLVV